MLTSPDIPEPKETEVSDVQQRQKFPYFMLVALLVVIHFVFLMVYFEPAISTPDANGYFAQAKLIANNHRTYLETESILQYVGAHWLKTDNNIYFCKYPPGLPAILSVVFRIFGSEATLLVNPLMASLSLLALFLLCRLWIGEWWGLLAATLMAFNPIVNQHALGGDSHTSTLFFLILALYFLAKWAKTHSLWWSFGTGLFLGIIPTIRYPEALFGLAFGIYVLLNVRRNRTAWRSLIAGVIGFAIPLSSLCIRNYLAFGAFWKTGYSLTNEQIGFGWNYFMSHSLQYLQQLQSEGCGLLFGLGLVGITVLCTRRETWKRGVLLAALIIPITLLYMSYYWPADQASMRFLLPTFFIYTIASVWLLRILSENQHRAVYALSAVILFVTIIWGLPLSNRYLQRLKYANKALAHVTRVLKSHVEPGCIVIANNSLNQHLDFVGFWRLADESVLMLHGLKSPQLLFIDKKVANPIQQMKMGNRQKRYGNLSGSELFNTFSQDIWQWAAEQQKVYWICNEKQINLYKQQLGQQEHFKIIEKIELPRMTVEVPDMPEESRQLFRAGREPMIRRPIPIFQGRNRQRPAGGMQRQLDFIMNGEPLYLVEWTKNIP